jgi:AraC-like DNA-binding protein
MACGYASITALNRAFKARYGMSPSDYRDKTTPRTDQLNVLSVRR